MVTICTSVPIWSRTWGAIGLVLSWLCHKFDFETCVNHDSFVMKAFFLLTFNYFYPFLSLSSKLLSVKLLRHIGWLRVKMTKKLRRKISARFAKRQAKRAVKRVPTNPFSNVFWRKGGGGLRFILRDGYGKVASFWIFLEQSCYKTHIENFISTKVLLRSTTSGRRTARERHHGMAARTCPVPLCSRLVSVVPCSGAGSAATILL